MEDKEHNELEKRNLAFLIYQDENGIARVNVRFEGEDVWLNVEQMMELFDASQQDVSYHINQIYDEGEQDPNRTHKKFLLVRQEGNKHTGSGLLCKIHSVPDPVCSIIGLSQFCKWDLQNWKMWIGIGKSHWPTL